MLNLRNKKILVTGADGFIGSHLTEHLVALGCNVRAFVYYNSFNSYGWLDSSSPEILRQIEVFSGDVRDPYGVKQAVQGCDVIMHLAALIAIPYSYHSPATYVDTNIHGTLNILQAARDHGVQKIIHTSTSEVYGSAQFVPITEEHPLVGQSPYAASKIGADQMALSFFRSFHTPVSVIRPFNTYGPRQSARAVIPTVITQMLENKSVKIGSTTPTRDFNFVSDTVRGFVAVAEAEEAVGEVINVGSNYEVSVSDVIQMIAEILGKPVQIKVEEDRKRPDKSEVDRLWGANAKALRLTGWQPEFAGREGLRRGLTKTIEWFADEKNLSRYKSDVYNK